MSAPDAPSHVVWQATNRQRGFWQGNSESAQPTVASNVTFCSRSDCSSSSSLKELSYSSAAPNDQTHSALGRRSSSGSSHSPGNLLGVLGHSDSSHSPGTLGNSGRGKSSAARPPLPRGTPGEATAAQERCDQLLAMHQVWDDVSSRSISNSSKSGPHAIPPTHTPHIPQDVSPPDVVDDHDDDDETDLPIAPVSGPLPSIGSSSHATGQCTPCGFLVMKKGCRLGDKCDHCHYDHPPRHRKKPCKWRRERAKKQLALSAAAADYLGTGAEQDPVYQSLKRSLLRGMGPLPVGRVEADEELPVFGVAALSGSNRKHIVSL